MKRCPDCKQTLPLEEFGRSKNRPGGISTYCKPCVRAQARQWRKDHPDCHRAWYEANADRLRAMARERMRRKRASA